MQNIKYTELVFKLKFLENTFLPKHKVLMLNGALLKVLLNLYCINDKECSTCKIFSRCFIQKLLGNRYQANKPLILQSSSIQPYYLIECNHKGTSFNQDQELIFKIRLLDKAIDYVSQFIYVFEQLSNIGIGKNRSKYQLIGIYNNKKMPIFEDGIFFEDNISIEYIWDYIGHRRSPVGDRVTLVFVTPFVMSNISLNPLINMHNFCYSIENRFKSLNILEEEDVRLLAAFEADNIINNYDLNIIKSQYPMEKLQKRKVIIGYKGKIDFILKRQDFIDYLIACEKLSIGSHILLGYGRFIIKGGQPNATTSANTD
ncbi:MAG: hypothetical protein GX080_01395 [Tissierellia bacterium]|nr:hypothetical protein [Tissierellia bacterium]